MRYRKIFLFAVCCVLLLSSCVRDDEKAEEYVKTGDEVPTFSVRDPNSGTKTFTSDNDFANKRSIIVLFTAECAHCRTLMPVVDDAWKELQEVEAVDDNWQIIAIARGSSDSAVAALWSANEMTMPYYLDPDRSAYSKFASRYVPRLYSVNDRGMIDWMQTGENGISVPFLMSILGCAPCMF